MLLHLPVWLLSAKASGYFLLSLLNPNAAVVHINAPSPREMRSLLTKSLPGPWMEACRLGTSDLLCGFPPGRKLGCLAVGELSQLASTAGLHTADPTSCRAKLQRDATSVPDTCGLLLSCFPQHSVTTTHAGPPARRPVTRDGRRGKGVRGCGADSAFPQRGLSFRRFGHLGVLGRVPSGTKRQPLASTAL